MINDDTQLYNDILNRMFLMRFNERTALYLTRISVTLESVETVQISDVNIALNLRLVN